MKKYVFIYVYRLILNLVLWGNDKSTVCTLNPVGFVLLYCIMSTEGIEVIRKLLGMLISYMIRGKIERNNITPFFIL